MAMAFKDDGRLFMFHKEGADSDALTFKIDSGRRILVVRTRELIFTGGVIPGKTSVFISRDEEESLLVGSFGPGDQDFRAGCQFGRSILSSLELLPDDEILSADQLDQVISEFFFSDSLSHSPA